MTILTKDPDSRMFDFVITREGVPDKEGDVLHRNEIEMALDMWLDRGGPMTDFHSNRVIGKGINYRRDKDGRYVGRGKIHTNSKIADTVWDKMKNHDYRSVSIGGGAFDKKDNKHGGEDLDDLEVLEVAVCPMGMHQDANILDMNTMAKGESSPYILKADLGDSLNLIAKPGAHSAKWDRCVEHVKRTNPTANAYAVCTSAIGDESFKGMSKSDEALVSELKKQNEKGGFDMSDVKKPDMDANQQISQQLASIQEQIQELKELQSGTPEPAVEEADEDENGNGSEEEDENGNGNGSSEEDENKAEDNVDQGPEVTNTPPTSGAEVKLPKASDDEREDVGQPGDQSTDESSAQVLEKVNKLEKSMRLLRKSLKKGSTPTPAVEKSGGQPEEIPSYEIVKGRKSLSDYRHTDRYDSMQREIDMFREFQRDQARGGGN